MARLAPNADLYQPPAQGEGVVVGENGLQQATSTKDWAEQAHQTQQDAIATWDKVTEWYQGVDQNNFGGWLPDSPLVGGAGVLAIALATGYGIRKVVGWNNRRQEKKKRTGVVDQSIQRFEDFNFDENNFPQRFETLIRNLESRFLDQTILGIRIRELNQINYTDQSACESRRQEILTILRAERDRIQRGEEEGAESQGILSRAREGLGNISQSVIDADRHTIRDWIVGLSPACAAALAGGATALFGYDYSISLMAASLSAAGTRMATKEWDPDTRGNEGGKFLSRGTLIPALGLAAGSYMGIDIATAGQVVTTALPSITGGIDALTGKQKRLEDLRIKIKGEIEEILKDPENLDVRDIAKKRIDNAKSAKEIKEIKQEVVITAASEAREGKAKADLKEKKEQARVQINIYQGNISEERREAMIARINRATEIDVIDTLLQKAEAENRAKRTAIKRVGDYERTQIQTLQGAHKSIVEDGRTRIIGEIQNAEVNFDEQSTMEDDSRQGINNLVVEYQNIVRIEIARHTYREEQIDGIEQYPPNISGLSAAQRKQIGEEQRRTVGLIGRVKPNQIMVDLNQDPPARNREIEGFVQAYRTFVSSLGIEDPEEVALQRAITTANQRMESYKTAEVSALPNTLQSALQAERSPLPNDKTAISGFVSNYETTVDALLTVVESIRNLPNLSQTRQDFYIDELATDLQNPQPVLRQAEAESALKLGYVNTVEIYRNEITDQESLRKDAVQAIQEAVLDQDHLERIVQALKNILDLQVAQNDLIGLCQRIDSQNPLTFSPPNNGESVASATINGHALEIRINSSNRNVTITVDGESLPTGTGVNYLPSLEQKLRETTEAKKTKEAIQHTLGIPDLTWKPAGNTQYATTNYQGQPIHLWVNEQGLVTVCVGGIKDENRIGSPWQRWEDLQPVLKTRMAIQHTLGIPDLTWKPAGNTQYATTNYQGQPIHLWVDEQGFVKACIGSTEAKDMLFPSWTRWENVEELIKRFPANT